jgi:hypothetical protein
MSEDTLMVCELWGFVTIKFGELFGEPLPQRMLSLGDSLMGWGCTLNATRDESVDGIPAYAARVTINGCPVAMLHPGGSEILIHDDVSEEEFRAWLEAQVIL